jgi:HNH endonuclease
LITRPRVRPLEYFPSWMRTEFPRDLREKHPIGTRFRADVTVKQKHHHIRALADGGADHPLNVAAVCPNCHSRVTHGKDAVQYNATIAANVKVIETLLQGESP